MFPSCSASSLAGQTLVKRASGPRDHVNRARETMARQYRWIFMYRKHIFVPVVCVCTAGTDRHLQLLAGESPHVTAAWSNDCACADWRVTVCHKPKVSSSPAHELHSSISMVHECNCWPTIVSTSEVYILLSCSLDTDEVLAKMRPAHWVTV